MAYPLVVVDAGRFLCDPEKRYLRIKTNKILSPSTPFIEEFNFRIRMRLGQSDLEREQETFVLSILPFRNFNSDNYSIDSAEQTTKSNEYKYPKTEKLKKERPVGNKGWYYFYLICNSGRWRTRLCA